MTNKSIWIQRSLIDGAIDPDEDELIEWVQVQEIIPQNPDGQVEIIVCVESEAEAKLKQNSGSENRYNACMDLCSSCGLLVASLTEHLNECNSSPANSLERELDSTCGLVLPSVSEIYTDFELFQNEPFKSPKSVKRVHSQKTSHIAHPKSFCCNNCNKEFNSQNHAKMHSATCKKDGVTDFRDEKPTDGMKMEINQCARRLRIFPSKQPLMDHDALHNCQETPTGTSGSFHHNLPSDKKNSIGIVCSKKPQCPKCFKTFTTMQFLKVHIEKKRCDKPPPCSRCGFIPKNLTSLRVHQRFCVNETLQLEASEWRSKPLDESKPIPQACKNLTCPLCNKRFATRKSWLPHIRRKICQKSLACKKCGKIFKAQGPLGKHQKTCNGICISDEFKCFKCGQRFNDNINLCRHAKRCPMLLSCEKCGNSFRRKGELEKHTKICNGIEWPTCKECGRTYSSKDALKKHISNNSCQRQTSCEKCGKVYIGKGALTNHKKICDGTPPSETTKCLICGHIFSTKQGLNQHVLNTSSPLTCKMCCRKFTSTKRFNTHQHICKGKNAETVIQCPRCHIIFSSEDALHQHLHNQICNKKLTCKKCGKTFKKEDCLITHEESCFDTTPSTT